MKSNDHRWLKVFETMYFHRFARVTMVDRYLDYLCAHTKHKIETLDFVVLTIQENKKTKELSIARDHKCVNI